MVKGQLDPVATRLNSSGTEDPTGTIEWLESQQRRRALDRRATWCCASGYALLTLSAIIASAVAWWMSGQVQEISGEVFGEMGRSHPMALSLNFLPALLLAIAACLVFIGGMAWAAGGVPGLRSARSAIDWSTASEAMGRLLSIGCTYPEALRTTSRVVRRRGTRDWLTRAAERIEAGGAELSGTALGDAAMAELLVEGGGDRPAGHWQIATEHFGEVARRRVAMLLGAVPILATLFSGLLVWASISASLGWMWRAVAELIGGLA